MAVFTDRMKKHTQPRSKEPHVHIPGQVHRCRPRSCVEPQTHAGPSTLQNSQHQHTGDPYQPRTSLLGHVVTHRLSQVTIQNALRYLTEDWILGPVRPPHPLWLF